MTETPATTSDAELTEGWAEPIFRADPAASRPSRPSAPRAGPAGAMSPPHGIQAFSAVPLPQSPSLAGTRAIQAPVKARNGVWLGVAVVGGVLLLGVIGFGVRVALRSPPAAAVRAPTRIELIQQGFARQRAAMPASADAPAKVAAPRPGARAHTAPAAAATAKPAPRQKVQQSKIQQQKAAPAQAPAGQKPSSHRSSKFVDEPNDPD